MKSITYVTMAILIASTAFSSPPTTVNIAGRTYRGIVGVVLNPNGTVGIVSGSALLKFQLKDVPAEFLTEWEISAEQIQAVKESTQAVIEAKKAKEEQEAKAKKAKEEQEAKAKIIADAKRPLRITPESRGGITLSHISHTELERDMRTKLVNLNTPEDKIITQLSFIPLGGTINAYIERSTIGAANTKYFTFIVFDSSGHEVMRHVGSDYIANVPSGRNEMWWNIELFNLKTVLQKPFTIRVIDTLMNESYEFKAE